MTQFSDDLYVGAAYYPPANVLATRTDSSTNGVEIPRLVVQQFGAVVVADPNGICDAVTSTAAGTLSATGALMSGATAVFDVPRNLSITSTGNLSGLTFSFAGEDEYGETTTEDITGPNNTTVYGLKAFLLVGAPTTTAAVSTAVNVGSGPALGFSHRLADKGKLLGIYVNGQADSTATATTTVVTAGLSTTAVSTATTGDVRGTVVPTTTPDSSKLFSALILLGGNQTKEQVYGVSQA